MSRSKVVQLTLEPTLDAHTKQSLLLAMAPLEPRRPAVLFERIVARVRDPDTGLLTVRATESAWTEIGPALHRKTIFAGEGYSAFLIRMDPGSTIPGHHHQGDEEALCLSGELMLDDGTIFREGDFHLARAGQFHGPIHSANGCLLYLRTANATK